MAVSENLIQQRLKLRRQTDGQMEIFQRFVEMSGQALCMADLEGQIFFANAALCRLLGKDHPEDFYEKNICDWYPPETSIRLQEEILPLVRQEGQWIGELSVIDVSGHIVSVIENIFILRNDAGKPLCFASVITDISERIGMEDELRAYRKHLEILAANRTMELEKTNSLLRAQIVERKEAEADRSRLAAILENTSDLVAMVTPEGRLIFINEAGRNMLGWEKERKDDILKRYIRDMHPPWALKIVLEEGIPKAKSIGAWKGETAIFGQDGREVPTSQVITAHRGADGEIEHFSTILRDIGHQKQVEKILQENLNMLAEAERIGRIGNWKWDLKSNDLQCSSGMLRIMDFPEKEKISFEQFLSRLNPDDVARAKSKSRETFAQGKSFTEEFRVNLPDGTVRYIAGMAEALLDAEKKPLIIRGAAQDITERKRFEEEIIKAQKLESIGTLAGGLAHDYNNLLATIMGSLEIIKMNMNESNRAFRTLEKAEQAALAASDLTKQLLTFSKGGYHSRRLMSLNNLLTETVRLALKGSLTEVEWKIADGLPKVNIDENQISQAIHNIVMNARDAMSQNGKIYIEADEVVLESDNDLKMAEGTYIRLIFRDEGPGIRDDYIPKLFDPYFSTKTAGNKKGLGLGLAVCYSIMKQHKGHIQIKSKNGVGTAVTLHIPAAWNKNHFPGAPERIKR